MDAISQGRVDRLDHLMARYRTTFQEWVTARADQESGCPGSQVRVDAASVAYRAARNDLSREMLSKN